MLPPARYCPALQPAVVQALAPDADDWPAGQARQLELPVTDEYWPEAHPVQLPDAGPL